jgi:hypothetical protein
MSSGGLLLYDWKVDNDLLGWAFDHNATGGSGTILPTAATIFVIRIPLPNPISVTNVLVFVTAKATGTLTDSFLGLWKSDGTIIGQTADQSSAWNTATGTAGLKTVALVGGPVTVTPLAANDFVWAGIYCGTIGTAGPTFGRGQAGVSAAWVNAGCTPARSRFASIALADTATLTTLIPANLTQTINAFWAALS